MLFKVTFGANQQSVCDFLCVNNSLDPNSHRFQVADYFSNFRCHQGVPLFNALTRGIFSILSTVTL